MRQPYPLEMLFTPGRVTIFAETYSQARRIYTDGRPLPEDPDDLFNGTSVGRWEGDTLWVETVGFNDKGWLDAMGHPHSDALRLTERIRRRDFGHLDIETTINDPKAYTKPITYTQKTTLMAEDDLLEYFCSDNEKDVQHFK